MQMPRLRFTVGRLMVAVLVAGLSIWLTRDFLLYPNIGEQQARTSYQQARLIREVAEYAVWEYISGDDLQEQHSGGPAQIRIGYSDRERAIDRMEWRKVFDREQALTPPQIALVKSNKSRQIKALQADIAKARADEQAKLATWRREQARRSVRWRILGF